MGRKKRVTKQQIADTLHKKRGAVYLTASALGVSYQTIYRHLAKYPDLQEIKDHYDGELVDKAELALHDMVDKSEAWAIKYTLSTKGKERGYTERQEITGKDGELIRVSLLTDD